MCNILRLFLNVEGINPWTVLTCLLLASVVEGIGFLTLVPLLMVATDIESADPSPSSTARPTGRVVTLHSALNAGIH